MAFLFKSKKQQERALASRDGIPGSSGSLQGSRSKDEKASLQRSTPTGSLNSLQDDGSAGSPDQGFGRRGPSVDQTQAQQQSDLPFRNGPQMTNPNAALYPWSQRRLTYTSSHPSPFPRYGAAVNSVSSKEGDIYVMGGLINSSTVKGDLWMIEAGSNMACYPLATTAEGPGPRVGHSSLLVGNAFIVYGGDTKIDEADVLDETLYLLNTSTRQWSRALPAGPRPSGRYGHSLNILGSKIYIFGGQVEGYFMNDLCAFDLNQLQMPNNRWEMLTPNSDVGAGGLVPQARTNHSMVTFNDKLFLFGGTNGYQWFNDIWCYDPTANKWTQLDCIGYIPVPREGHAAALVDDVMYIFGGRTEDGTDLGDLAAFRITSRRWYTFQNMGPSPSARSGHRMTAVGKSVVVLGGEPSSAASSVNDLGLVYVLDTSKIRYPNDSQSPSNPQQRVPQGNRRPSASDQGTQNVVRQLSSRDGSSGPPDSKRLIGAPNAPQMTNAINGFRSPPNGTDPNAPSPSGSKLPRAAGTSPPAGPPPQGPTPAKPIVATSNIPRPRGPSTEREAATNVSTSTSNQSPTTREPAKEESPVTNGRRTPTQQALKPATRPDFAAVETPKAKPKQRSPGSIDSNMEASTKPPANRPASPPPPTRQTSNPLSRRSSGRNSQTVALLKELDAARNRNAWYASELELARKAGYVSNSTLSPVLDSRATETFDDEDKPLIEALIAMKNELAKVQASVDKQAIVAAKQIAEAEKQRDAAIQEAVYAKAKLAAHGGGSAASTPQLDNDRDVDGSDRTGELNKKLASALSLQRDLHAQMESVKAELEAEKRSRQLADETSNASQKRMTELESYRQATSTEMAQLKSELHKIQREAREHSIAATEAAAAVSLLRAEKEELSSKYNQSVGNDKERGQTLESLRQSVAASAETTSHLERKLEEERSLREKVEAKLTKLKAEHEARTAELVAATQRLRDAEELAEKHAQEARTHRQAVLSGLDKVATRDVSKPNKGDLERLAALQSQVTATTALVKRYQQEADTASEKLRAAEERIAGLEIYQEQASRDGVAIRKQLQVALRETQMLQAQNSDLKRELSSQQLETNAMTVQHNTLKDILSERDISPTTSAARSRGLNSPRAGSPEQARLRELEQQLASTTAAHEQSKQVMTAQLQASETQYRDKLAQLESDYNSAIAYLKSTEKMLKKLKDEHAVYKAENKRLKSEVEELQDQAQAAGASSAPADWESERGNLYKKIEHLQGEVRASSSQMEKRLVSISTELDSAKRDRDAAVRTAEDASRRVAANKQDLEQLQQENSLLEQRARDAEHKVALLLDQVETSVDNYRRRSRQIPSMNSSELAGVNGVHAGPAGPGPANHARNDSSEAESVYGPGGIDGRNSVALDNLANELETLRSHWEATNKNYRLSNTFEFETSIGARKEDDPNGLGLSESLADWRKRLDVEEKRGHGEAPAKSKTRPERS